MNALDRVLTRIRPRRQPPAEFWQALLTVHNDVIGSDLFSSCQLWKSRGKAFLDSLRLIDCWIDEAVDRGWLDEDER